MLQNVCAGSMCWATFALFWTFSKHWTTTVSAFGIVPSASRDRLATTSTHFEAVGTPYDSHNVRRSLLQSAGAVVAVAVGAPSVAIAAAKQQQPLDELLYRIVRVREATQQEARLIKNGKFKDVQRANVKLAVKFMVQNYRLNDAFVGASSYLDGNDRRVQAGQVGQTVVQNLQTILEYFDSSDVQNLKVGSMDGMSGKEALVLKGLDSTRKSIDDFLAFFPAAEVEQVKKRVQEENELNVKEFDSSLGTIVNLPPPS